MSLIARTEDAELVALRIGQDNPAYIVAALANVSAPGTERFQAADLRGLVLIRRGGEINMQAVLGALLLRYRHEDQAWSPLASRLGPGTVGNMRRHHHDLAGILVNDLPRCAGAGRTCR